MLIRIQKKKFNKNTQIISSAEVGGYSVIKFPWMFAIMLLCIMMALINILLNIIIGIICSFNAIVCYRHHLALMVP